MNSPTFPHPTADAAPATGQPATLATPRSLRLTLYDGWRMVVLHPKHSLLHLLPPALCTAAALATLFHVLSSAWPALFVSPHFLGEGSIYAEHPEAAFSVTDARLWPVAGAMVLVLLTLAWCKGTLWHMIATYHRQGDNAALSWRQVFGGAPLHLGLRWLLFTAATAVAALLLLAIIGAAAWGICSLFGVAIPLWIWPLAFAVIYTLVSWVAGPLRFARLVANDGALSFGALFRMGMRRMGMMLLLVLLTAIPLVLIAFIFILPYLTMVVSGCTATICALPGEDLGLPSHFVLWTFVLGAASMTFVVLCSSVQTWVMAHKMASLTNH